MKMDHNREMNDETRLIVCQFQIAMEWLPIKLPTLFGFSSDTAFTPVVGVCLDTIARQK
jgi:hypothetical protein